VIGSGIQADQWVFGGREAHLAPERTFDLSDGRELLGYCPGQTQLGDAAGW